MARNNWYPRNPSDYLIATLGLSLEADGLYSRLLDAYWENGPFEFQPGKLEETLARFGRVHGNKFKNLWPEIKGYFTLENDGKLHNKRMDEELAKADALRARAKKGAAARWGDDDEQADAKGDAQADACDMDTTTTTTTTGNTSVLPITPTGYPDEFEAIWASKPKRAGGNSKKGAYKAYCARIKEGANPIDILAGVERYASFIRATEKEGTQYVMQMQTFMGPDEHYTEEWQPPTNLQQRGKPNATNSAVDRVRAANQTDQPESPAGAGIIEGQCERITTH